MVKELPFLKSYANLYSVIMVIIFPPHCHRKSVNSTHCLLQRMSPLHFISSFSQICSSLELVLLLVSLLPSQPQEPFILVFFTTLNHFLLFSIKLILSSFYVLCSFRTSDVSITLFIFFVFFIIIKKLEIKIQPTIIIMEALLRFEMVYLKFLFIIMFYSN